MAEDDQQELPQENVGIVDESQKAKQVPFDRAGVDKGKAARVIAKYEWNKHISITEIIGSKQKKKQLYVAGSRLNPSTKKVEYQLKESKDVTDKLYSNGKWFPETQVRLA